MIRSSVGPITLLNIDTPGPKLDNRPAGSVYIPGLFPNGKPGTDALTWTIPYISWYRDIQLLSVIDGMATALVGNVSSDEEGGMFELTHFP